MVTSAYSHLLIISHSLSVLGWYIPGLSELPLRNRLPSLLGGPFQRLFVFSVSLGTLGPFFPFFFLRFVCLCVLRVRHRGRG